jgi:hypothetical protein
MSRAAVKQSLSVGLGGEVAIEAGAVFRARGHAPGGYRFVRVVTVDREQGNPIATVTEVAPACAHGAIAALSGGTCPLCPRVDGKPFRVQLTHAKRDGIAAWVMPAWYEAT